MIKVVGWCCGVEVMPYLTLMMEILGLYLTVVCASR